jgi:hypothetical protein
MMKNERAAVRPATVMDEANNERAATCGNCRFGDAVPNPDIIRCKGAPPTVTKVDAEAGTITSHWPLLTRTEWCGAHRARGAHQSRRTGA